MHASPPINTIFFNNATRTSIGAFPTVSNIQDAMEWSSSLKSISPGSERVDASIYGIFIAGHLGCFDHSVPTHVLEYMTFVHQSRSCCSSYLKWTDFGPPARRQNSIEREYLRVDQNLDPP